VLDAQFFGVAQRRRRVFVVGYLGDWRAAAAVLFERHSLQGHPAPSREKRQDPPASIGTGAIYGGSDINTADTVTSKWAKGSGGPAGNECGLFVAQPIAVDIDNTNLTGDVIGNLCAEAQSRTNKGMGVMQPIVVDRAAFNQGENAQYQFRAEHSETMDSLVARGPHAVLQPAYGIPGNWIGRKPENGGNATEPMYDIAPCLTKADQHGVAQPIAFSGQMSNPQTDVDMTQTLQAKNPMAVAHSVVAPTLTAANDPSRSPQSSEVTQQVYSVYQSSMAVRRLTPTECERLQGFPDSYTDIKSKNKPTPDGPRYKALGNSMAVPVMAWIGQRIEQVEAICKQNK
jgi:DNA (cytosine-5)-methyltransferase 1